MYRYIEEITGRRTCLSTGCIRSKAGDIIMEKEKILNRWAEYINELFDDQRHDFDVTKKNFAGPPIMKDEIRAAIRKMKAGKATGPDKISVEMIEALEEFGIEKVTELLNEIYDTGQIPTDISKSIFIALPKKPGATECELHRTISLMSHITKILLRIVMLRVRNKIKPEIAEEQCGFVEGKGTTNALYILRTLIERALEVQKDIYLCFIDYTKAFDRRSLFRTVLMIGFHFVVWFFCVRGIRDTQCGFKLLTRGAALLLFRNLHVERWDQNGTSMELATDGTGHFVNTSEIFFRNLED
ncbi:dolichyl-phosphate beta-glucosyltransferase [Plakobranchus ocellatus]|uniref:Dolichyl-phosphate beta-glucosyltransferase n=1 Tax=Plakobranchus ocellatus TaxID=259542 RepID=A0AAV3ZU88_9GAST|nr:dolichyl-phosphate beta-glucosyltransferase [Plakobranchus ocellatus]